MLGRPFATVFFFILPNFSRAARLQTAEGGLAHRISRDCVVFPPENVVVGLTPRRQTLSHSDSRPEDGLLVRTPVNLCPLLFPRESALSRVVGKSVARKTLGCNTRTSQEVTHPSTTLAQARLTSEF